MSENGTIIDVNPVASVRDNATAATTETDRFVAPSFGKQDAQSTPVVPATVIGGDSAAANVSNRIGGIVQTVVGGAVMLVGVPMLILPGPGLLAIGGGAVVAGKGIKKILGK